MSVDILKLLFADFILTLYTITPYCRQNYRFEELLCVFIYKLRLFLWTH
jgi:hypothetical protein